MLKLAEGYTPRWIILSIDIAIVFIALVMSYLLRFDFSIPASEIVTFKVVIPVVIGVRAISFLVARIPWAIVRYMSQRDAMRILLTIIAGTVFFYAFNQITYRFVNGVYYIPHSIILIEFLSTTFGLISSRLIYKALWTEIRNPSSEKKNVIIYGAGESGLITKRTLDRDAGSNFRVTAFIDDDETKQGKKLEGTTIYPT
ncbi:MAG TPA: hypothetical protein VK826_17870, partial [Bacteroidia bacterium]|nr:hypothetical protein [Bacteroidia bacterium]